jgi:hypothetical protein
LSGDHRFISSFQRHNLNEDSARELSTIDEEGGLTDEMDEMSDNEILAFSSSLEGGNEPGSAIPTKPKVHKKPKKKIVEEQQD